MLPSSYDPQKSIPDLSGRVIVVTGATGGLGKATVEEIAKHKPEKIFITGRSKKRADEVIESIRNSGSTSTLTFVECELNSLQSVKAAAEKIKSDSPDRIDLFIANAGIMATDPGLTKDGYEDQFGTNHVGHAALLKGLLPIMLQTAEAGNDVRIVMVSSEGHKFSTGIPYDRVKSDMSGFMGGWMRYGHSKLANILYAKALAKQYPSITSVAIHPGVISTGLSTGLSLGKRAFIYVTTFFSTLSIEDGVKNHLWASFCSKSDIQTGKYYKPVGEKDGDSAAAKDEKAADKLYEWTQETLSTYGI